MMLMHQCPRCGEIIGTDGWCLARADAFSCDGCGLTSFPSPELRRVAQRLLRVRKEVDLEQTAAANHPSRPE
jgi:predicted  nucleic acid-binding Zn-ribbon protein